MVRKIILGLLLAGSFDAHAAEWVPLPNAGSADQYFYDKSKLVVKDDEITYWKKVLFKIPQPIKGNEATIGILRERINCTEHTAKLMSYLYYAASGESIDYVAQDDSPPAPIIPDTVGDIFDQTLCPMVWRKQEEARIKAEQAGVEAELKQSEKKNEQPAASSVIPVPVKPTPPQAPNVRLPEKQPATPLPMPQIMEQLY